MPVETPTLDGPTDLPIVARLLFERSSSSGQLAVVLAPSWLSLSCGSEPPEPAFSRRELSLGCSWEACCYPAWVLRDRTRIA